MDWTNEDRRIAEEFRLKRLRGQIPQLQRSLLHLDLEYVLHVYTYKQIDAAALTVFATEFQQQVYITLGCRDVSVWFENELAFQRSLDLQSALTLDDDDEDLPMSTAVAERASDATMSASADNAPSVMASLPGQTIAAIAEDTDQPVESIQSWIGEHGWPIIPFNGDLIISGEAAIAALKHFSEVQTQQRLAKRGLLQPVNADRNGSAPEPADPPATQPVAKPKATKSTKTPRSMSSRVRPNLTLPAAYPSRIIKGQTKKNFERALPVKPELRGKYLQEIVNETADGKLFVDRVVTAIVKKFGGSKDKLAANVIGLAKSMQAGLQPS